MSAPGLWMRVVYRSPADYPGRFVLRLWEVDGEGPHPRDAIVADSLDEIRASLPGGLTRIARSPDDDPVIVETWI